ncbi:MAG: molybdenum cofactor guanylyltransferase [candidate division KSB1 bacterium]|nr:molybdenum cofactor guanylyltransferase [candidate division KSB1 bacterium]MDZ7365583.1 molybdenum cofactor guanylyltransferase [candidate division KSB1 bacterium]MDZ7403685.1 molybdenum cofactor guanylyltransferase [candidate division KSB1 bacterium]
MHFYILAGGKSRRFGRNKALFVMEGKSIIECVAAAIPPEQKIFIVTNSPAEYAHFPWPLLPDHYPGSGPLAGIHAGLTHSPGEWNFFLACDFPCLKSSVINELLAAPRNAQVILPETTAGLQPLCALWSQSALPAVENALQNHDLRLHAVLAKLALHVILPTDPQALYNLNTPEDLNNLPPHFPEMRKMADAA